MRVLLVTAVAAELASVGLPGIVAGIGPAAAAAATSAALAGGGYDLVVSAGIAGGFAPLGTGDIAVASTIAHADLGRETPGGFEQLSAATASYDVPPALAVELADRTGGHLGTIVTVSTVTGTAATADALLERFPDAVAEGMEGAGVAAAAAHHGLACAEIRAISNQVGPRGDWHIDAALAALGDAVRSAARGWQS